jgi:hypothetical protein
MRRMISWLTQEIGGFGRSASGPTSGPGLPCAVCGQAATGWVTGSAQRDGDLVIDGYAACLVHHLEAQELPRTKAG